MEDPKHLYPLVSVVIPTRERPGLVGRAVKSALRQTLDEIEVIVVIDGPDEETFEVLHHIQDSRLRVKMLPIRIGVGEARNAGVNESRGKWVALLDDDDEWFPHKLEVQLRAIKDSPHPCPILSCRFIARMKEGDLIWPRRYPEPNEPLSEYLFCQRGLFGGEGFIAMPSIFTTKHLLQRVPFGKGLGQHQDWDWLLRVSEWKGVRIQFVPDHEPLFICNMEENRPKMWHTTDWRYSLSWGEAHRGYLTTRAYISFILTRVSVHAARVKDWEAFWVLLLEACRHGKPSLIDIWGFLAVWLIPQKVRRKGAVLYRRLRGSTISLIQVAPGSKGE
jgi:glycosyltransferase involved in cell wall biosynthesis